MTKCQFAGCENDAELMCHLTVCSCLYCYKHFYEVFFPELCEDREITEPSQKIKYKAWIKSHRWMLQVTAIDFSGGLISHADGQPCFCGFDNEGHSGCFLLSDDTILRRYIERGDKRNNEIYEGDICKLDILGTGENYDPPEALLVVVEWRNISWGFKHLYPELVAEEDREWRPFYDCDDKEMWDKKYFEIVSDIYQYPKGVEEAKRTK